MREDVLISLVTRDVRPKTLGRTVKIRRLENTKRVRRTFRGVDRKLVLKQPIYVQRVKCYELQSEYLNRLQYS